MIAEALSKYDFKYIMYRGGAGGEFLTYNISKCSDDYEELIASDFGNNRWNLEVPAFINAIALSRCKQQPIDTLIDRIKDLIVLKGLSEEQVIANLEKYLANRPRKKLFRAHISLNEYFYGRTYFLNLDNQQCFDYCNILQYIKVGSREIEVGTPEFNDSFFGNGHLIGNIILDQSILTRTSKLLIQGIGKITYAHLNILHSNFLSDSNISEDKLVEFLNTTPDKLKDQYYDFFFQKLKESRYESEQNIILPNTIPIIYSRLFEDGYLEGIFNIKTDEFRKNLLKWHQDNLILMREFGFDVSPYV